MRCGRNFACLLPKASSISLIAAMLLCGSVPAPLAAQAKAKRAASARTSAPVALPTGHIGQEYGTKILGVTGIDVGDATCSAVTGLPRGLELNCDKMTIHGQPLETTDAATVRFTVSDSEGHSVPLAFALTVIDGMDVVRVGAKSASPITAASISRAPSPVATTASARVQRVSLQTPAAAIPATPTTSSSPAKSPSSAPASHPLVAATTPTPSPSPEEKPTPTPVPPTDSAQLPRPNLTDVSLIREGVQTISGSCDPAPNPPIPMDPSATPPVAGNIPSVSVQVRDANSSSDEWQTADLVVSPTSAQTTAPIQPATIAAGHCTFKVMLKTALTPGEKVRVVLTAPGAHQFSDKPGDNSVNWPDDGGKQVYTALAVAPPVITSPIVASGTKLAGIATPSPSGGPVVNIAAISDDDYDDLSPIGAARPFKACLTPEELKKDSGRFLQLAGDKVYAPTDATGAFSATLADPLVEGQRFHLVQILPAYSELTDTEIKECKTTVSVVKTNLDWGRIHADFTAGVLISNDSQNTAAGTAGSGDFSQAHQFLALSVEKSWALPGCYLRTFAHRGVKLDDKGEPVFEPDQPVMEDGKPVMKDGKPVMEKGQPVMELKPDECFDSKHQKLQPARLSDHFLPGVSTYFQTRLTAIPVSTVATDGSATPMGANVISSAQTARVEVGAYLPFLVTRWVYDHQPNALFIAPLAKVGFDTVTGASSVSTILPGGTTDTRSYEQVYNFWSYGAKIGHMELTRTENKAPEVYSYLDIAFGPYSNLQSYICHAGTADPTTTNSTCVNDYGSGFGVDSRKRLYRFDIEGLLKIPKTFFYVGLNANIGQKTLGATHLDHGFAAPDDVRFLFGTKFDIASVLTKFKLTPQ